MITPRFPHLNLIEKARGQAHLEGRGETPPEVLRNQTNRTEHGSLLIEKFNHIGAAPDARRELRSRERLPQIEGGVPFLIRIPDEADEIMEFLTERLGLELVAEYEGGFLIVSADRLDLDQVLSLVNAFIVGQRGGGRMASILEIDEDPLSERRIQRLLDPALAQRWPFGDAETLMLDVSIEVAAFGAPGKPRGITKRTRESVKQQKLEAYTAERIEYFERWDEERIRREQEIERFVSHYDGQILRITDDSAIVEFPDSFSMRIRMSGKGFTDLIKNYPNLFEVTLPDEFSAMDASPRGEAHPEYSFELNPPSEGSPSICVVDSGIQEEHRWLRAAIDPRFSRCFLPDSTPNDTADYVRSGGHGTRVAGACLYPIEIPKSGAQTAPFWLLNARVLDDHCLLPESVFPAQLIEAVVRYYRDTCDTRIFQHSISASTPCRTQRMSLWASMLDQLSHSHDVLFLQATGNLPSQGSPSNPGIADHLSSQREYPDYLYQPSSRIANPAQSLQAITVGSISGNYFSDGDRSSLSPARHPSSFTRTGFGLWNSIKPEVVEFGGDDVRDTGTPPSLTTPPAVCPETLRSTLHGGPAIGRDCVGTSFSTPKVAHIAGQLAALFPDREALLYRALIVNSARWPEWAELADPSMLPDVVRSIGYGIPDLERATENTPNRITLITHQLHGIQAGEGYIFGIPIPDELRRPGDDFQVRIDVTLSYSAEPRRTRKSRRGYLGVWLDWKSSKKRESFDTFRARALKNEPEDNGPNDGNFPWTLGRRSEKDGQINGVSRSNGTVQKDWTYANSYELPDVFGVVVRGHKGWDRRNQESEARFSLVVSFEALRGDVRIYEQIELAIEAELRAEHVIEIQSNS